MAVTPEQTLAMTHGAAVLILPAEARKAND
jgi:hypothetical protein